MRLDKYLTEKEVDIEEKIKKLLTRDCSQFLKECGGNKFTGILYRGTQKSIKNIKAFTPREDRYPKDTPKKLHDIMDNLFRAKFGWKVRSEGVFVTSDMPSANHYGTSYLFFPFDGYKYLFNPQIKDLFAYSEAEEVGDELEFARKIKRSIKDSFWYSRDEDSILDDFEKTMREYIIDYKDTNLPSGIKRKVEITFKCKKYYLINKSFLPMIVKFLQFGI